VRAASCWPLPPPGAAVVRRLPLPPQSTQAPLAAMQKILEFGTVGCSCLLSSRGALFFLLACLEFGTAGCSSCLLAFLTRPLFLLAFLFVAKLIGLICDCSSARETAKGASPRGASNSTQRQAGPLGDEQRQANPRSWRCAAGEKLRAAAGRGS